MKTMIETAQQFVRACEEIAVEPGLFSPRLRAISARDALIVALDAMALSDIKQIIDRHDPTTAVAKLREIIGAQEASGGEGNEGTTP